MAKETILFLNELDIHFGPDNISTPFVWTPKLHIQGTSTVSTGQESTCMDKYHTKRSVNVQRVTNVYISTVTCMAESTHACNLSSGFLPRGKNASDSQKEHAVTLYSCHGYGHFRMNACLYCGGGSHG